MKSTCEQIVEAASNTHNLGKMQFKFIELFGKQAEFVQGERRFQTRRLRNKTYLMDARLLERRGH